MAITFNTINPEALIFQELSKEPMWWKRFKDNPSLYIEVRKDNQVNVYFEGGSVARIHYCSKHKRLQVFTHHLYLDMPAPSKNNYYIECSSFIDNAVDDIHPDILVSDKIIERVKECYSQKHAVNGLCQQEKWSEKYIQGSLIVQSRAFHLDSEFAYKDKEGTDIRIDLIRCDNGKVSFVELKRMDDGRMLHKTDETPEVVAQMKLYNHFLEKYSKELLVYYQKIYDIKQNLGLPVPTSRPESIDTTPVLLIFDRWIKETKGRNEHRRRLIEILNRESIKYYIKNQL